ncbi:MAG: hypothetical protein Q7W51_08370 [Coriobacteriia bacterium]|nr:hypothetical protein [Coriobacteriia bacterium]
MSKSGFGYIDLSRSWLVSAVPVLAYSVAFLSRVGEAFVRKVPVDWIVISLTDALSRTALVSLVVLAMFMSARAEAAWVCRHPTWTHRAASNFLEQLAPLTMMLVLLGQLVLAVSFGVVFVVVTAGMALRDYRRRDSLPSRKREIIGPVILEAGSGGEDKPATRVSAQWAMSVLMVALVLAPVGGAMRALVEQDFLVDPDQTTIIVASYGHVAVLADLDVREDGEWVVGSTRRLVDLTSEPGLVFEMKRAPWFIDW